MDHSSDGSVVQHDLAHTDCTQARSRAQDKPPGRFGLPQASNLALHLHAWIEGAPPPGTFPTAAWIMDRFSAIDSTPPRAGGMKLNT